MNSLSEAGCMDDTTLVSIVVGDSVVFVFDTFPGAVRGGGAAAASIFAGIGVSFSFIAINTTGISVLSCSARSYRLMGFIPALLLSLPAWH